MASKIKNILIFTIIATLLILGYIFFIKKGTEEQGLVSSFSDFSNSISSSVDTINKNSSITSEFLAILLSIENIKLDDSILSEESFTSLRDSSITLTPLSPEEEGRLNPFAPIGREAPIVDSNTKTPIVPTVPPSAPNKTP